VPFFPTKADIGTGIGLWVTKGLIEKQGGLHALPQLTGKGSGGRN
jgi:hypothetical protein